MTADDKTEAPDPTTMTVAKTLWSETLIDLLVVSLEKNQSDDKVTDLLKELKQKSLKKTISLARSIRHSARRNLIGLGYC